MIEEAIKHIQETTKTQLEPAIFHMPGEADHVVWVRTNDGSLQKYSMPPAVQIIQIATVADLAALVTSNHRGVDPAKMVLFIRPGGATVEFDAEHLTDEAHLPFPWTEAAQAIHGIAQAGKNGVAFTPRELRNLLEWDLLGCYENVKLPDLVSNLTFEDTTTTTQSAGRMRESLGNSVVQECKPQEELPAEWQTFRVRMFANLELDATHPIQVNLRPDLASKQWNVRIRQADWQKFRSRSIASARRVIEAAIGESEVAIYEGEVSKID